MAPVRASLLIDAPPGAVRRALRRTDVWTRTARALGARAQVAGERTGPRAALRATDLVRVRSDRPERTSLLAGRSLIFRVRLGPGPESVPGLELVAGPLTHCRVSVTVAGNGDATLVTVETTVGASTGTLLPVPRSVIRRRAEAAMRLLLGITTLAAREIQVVVAGAVIDGNRVLAARRRYPDDHAGLWELPGGKVEPGETDESALIRELAEELGITVDVGSMLGQHIDLGDNRVLRCYRSRITDGAPVPTEHDAIRWVTQDEVDAVHWLPADRHLIEPLKCALRSFAASD